MLFGPGRKIHHVVNTKIELCSLYLIRINFENFHPCFRTATSKPTLIFVPGAWRMPSVFSRLIDRHSTHGYVSQGLFLLQLAPNLAFQTSMPTCQPYKTLSTEVYLLEKT
ncbi:hypothetical protein N7G274_009253 [Stereocaulon virgatum]|uniref:Uncharacterized protein n=1 Tax=Stereocaulon virgatum TaxID=373712 RepID=A0ABR4A3W9_9LECA